MKLARSLFVLAVLVGSLGATVGARTAPSPLAPPSSPLRADDAGFENAVAAYREGDLETARSLWQAQLEDDAVSRADVLFNLGNVAFRQGRPLEAAAYYTACIRLEPRNQDAWTNLEFVRGEAGLEPADRGDLTSTARRLVSMLTLAEAERVLVFLTALWGAILAYEALRGGAFARRLAWAGFVVVALAAIPWAWQLSREGDAPYFVIGDDGAPLHAEPRDGATLLGRLLPAEEAERIDALPGWVRLRHPDGRTGWAEAETVMGLD